MKIFNHDITLSTHDRAPGTHLFSGRALPLTNPGDKVQIHPALASEWEAITSHYAQIGIEHTQEVIWDVSLAEIERHSAYEPCFYFFGDAVDPASKHHQFFKQQNSKWCQTVEFVNSKNNFIQLAEELGIPVPKTFRFENLAAAMACDSLPFPCYVKPAVSDHGCGIMRCPNETALAEAFAQLSPDEPLQIQAEVKASVFLNLQYHVTSRGIEPLLVTEQILEGCVHGGNRYPTEHAPWEEVAPFAKWMGEQGMRGIFAVDVAVVPTADGVKYLAIECNPRYNGSSYPTLVAHRLGVPCWSSATCEGIKRSLSDFELADLAFNPATGKGVVLVNWGTIKVGRLSVLLAGSPAEQTALSRELQARLAAVNSSVMLPV